jgi:hydroxymethylglutaryl-CoA lyase
MLVAARGALPAERLALHFHDTSGAALANVEEALGQDIRIFDAAAGGLGGCPFAPGAPGNLATAPLVERLAALGLRTGVDVPGLSAAVALLRPHVARLNHVPE